MTPHACSYYMSYHQLLLLAVYRYVAIYIVIQLVSLQL